VHGLTQGLRILLIILKQAIYKVRCLKGRVQLASKRPHVFEKVLAGNIDQKKPQVIYLSHINWNLNNMANGEPLAVRELLFMPPVLGIIYRKIIIEDFCILSCVLYKELYKYNFIYSILGKILF